METSRKSTLQSTLGSTRESTPIPESTPEGTLGSTFGGLPVLGSLAGRQTLKTCPLTQTHYKYTSLRDIFVNSNQLSCPLNLREAWGKEELFNRSRVKIEHSATLWWLKCQHFISASFWGSGAPISAPGRGRGGGRKSLRQEARASGFKGAVGAESVRGGGGGILLPSVRVL